MKLQARISNVHGMPGWTFALTVGDPQSVVVTPPAGETITPDRWRSIPIAAVLNALRMETASAQLKLELAKLGEPPKRPHGGSREHRIFVAYVYRRALVHGAKPLEVIGDLWQKSDRKTAIDWVKEARKHGFLLPTNAEEKQRMRNDPLWGIAEPDSFEGIERPETPTTPKLTATRRVHGPGSITTKEES